MAFKETHISLELKKVVEKDERTGVEIVKYVDPVEENYILKNNKKVMKHHKNRFTKLPWGYENKRNISKDIKQKSKVKNYIDKMIKVQ